MSAEKNGLVVKSNRLIEASYRLSRVEQLLILQAIVQCREEQCGLTATKPVTIVAAEFAARFGLEPGSVYGQMKEALNGLYTRDVRIHDIHPKSGKPRVVNTRWISDKAYIDGEGIVELTFTPKVVPFITRLEKEFTSYRLEKVGKMTGAHAIRLYELLLQYLAAGQREIELENLKEMLGIPGEYKAIKDLKKRVVDPALKQIKEHTDIDVSYENVKRGRTVTGFIFTIKAKSDPEIEQPKKVRKKTVINDAYIKKHARPGESSDQVMRRLLEESGQQRLSD